ncbi:hypothetical protein MASR2M48_29710 [Spirochaetota bacterium]
MGYDRRRVADALAKVDAGLPETTQDREQEMLRRAIVELSAS